MITTPISASVRSCHTSNQTSKQNTHIHTLWACTSHMCPVCDRVGFLYRYYNNKRTNYQAELYRNEFDN
eukprot:359944-Chlamydomonas_euryale.AAC.3